MQRASDPLKIDFFGLSPSVCVSQSGLFGDALLQHGRRGDGRHDGPPVETDRRRVGRTARPQDRHFHLLRLALVVLCDDVVTGSLRLYSRYIYFSYSNYQINKTFIIIIITYLLLVLGYIYF